jgi:selenocysteine lyase/cysteine desulfurase
MLIITIQLWPQLQLLKGNLRLRQLRIDENRSSESFEALERLLRKFSKSYKSHVKNMDKKITLADKIAKIAKQDSMLDCIDPAQKAEAIEVDVKKIRRDS